jgi:hypothetical protein
VTVIQLFGGALNANPHFHSIFADGVFCERADGQVEFVLALSPTDEDVVRICEQVVWRVQRLVERRLEQDSVDDAAQEAERQLAFAPLPMVPRHEAGWEHPDQQGRRVRRSAMVDGFSLHADVSVDAEDRKGLERLCRYTLRSAFSRQRVSVLPDGAGVLPAQEAVANGWRCDAARSRSPRFPAPPGAPDPSAPGEPGEVPWCVLVKRCAA